MTWLHDDEVGYGNECKAMHSSSLIKYLSCAFRKSDQKCEVFKLHYHKQGKIWSVLLTKSAWIEKKCLLLFFENAQFTVNLIKYSYIFRVNLCTSIEQGSLSCLKGTGSCSHNDDTCFPHPCLFILQKGSWLEKYNPISIIRRLCNGNGMTFL